MATLARTPYARLTHSDPGVDREFQKIERSGLGVFVPRVITHALSPYTVQATDWLLLCDCTAGAITLTFPLAARVDGLHVMVIKTDASANAVTLSGTFNGVVNPTLGVRYQSKTINAGNGSYYFVPTLTAADILSGTFPGNYVIAGTLEVDGNFSVGNPTKFTVTASSGNTNSAGHVWAGDYSTFANTNASATLAGVTQIDIVRVGAPPAFRGVWVGTSLTAPSAVTSGANIGDFVGSGYDGSAVSNAGTLRFKSTEAWSGTARGTQLILFLPPNGSTAANTIFTMNGDKSVVWTGAHSGMTTLAISSDFSVATSKFTVTASSGNTSVAGTLAVTSDFAINTSKFTVTASSGNTVVAGTLTTSGLIQATVTGESLRLRYDASNYVSFAVSSTGGLTITPQSGQAVSVTTFAASGKAALSAQTRVGDLFRVESVASPDTSGLAGAGVEITYDPTNFGIIKAYDYTGSALKHLKVDASGIQFTNAVSIDTGGFTSTASTVATISQVTTTTGAVNARWTNNTNYTVELGYTGSGSVAYQWGTTGTGLALGANSTEMLRFVSGGDVQVASGVALKLGNAYTAGAPAATGYVTLKDSAGTTYKVLVST